MHLLLFLHPDDRFLTVEKIDEIISAELPSIQQDPTGELKEIIGSSMVHRPCGSTFSQTPYMQSLGTNLPAKCSKEFPKPWQATTAIQDDGYPLYRRSDNGNTYLGKNGFIYTKQLVVPYNLYLSLRYQAHINVEVCALVKAIKYIHKYIYKGSDRTTLQLQAGEGGNEIKKFLQGRYIGPCEAVWRLLEFRIHEEFPTVYQLPIHLPGEQPVYFSETATAIELQAPPTTTSTDQIFGIVLGLRPQFSVSGIEANFHRTSFSPRFLWCPWISSPSTLC